MSKQVFVESKGLAVGFEPTSNRLRFYFEPPVGDTPDFQGIGSLEYLTEDTCAIKGAHGKMTMGHMAIIATELNRKGIRWLFTHRTKGKTPLSTVIPDGVPFAGWYLTDLAAVVTRLEAKELKTRDKQEEKLI